MIIFPAIDLKDGHCVRLLRGEMDKATVFSNKPAEQAKSFEDAGFEWLHLVDLNGAFEGRPVNQAAVKEILATVDMPVQLGGGIRNLQLIETWIEAGIARIILGTAALRNPEFVREACSAFPGQIAVGIDAKAGMVAVSGWAEVTDITALELALKFEDAGVAAIIYTDIARDGAMGGPNIEETAKLASQLSTPVIVSGGVSKIADVDAIHSHVSSGISGMIIGRALYEKSITLPELKPYLPSTLST